MNATYEWLYDNYAHDTIEEIFQTQERAVDQLTQRLSLDGESVVLLHDYMTDMRLRWGAEVFTLGLRLGLRLTERT